MTKVSAKREALLELIRDMSEAQVQQVMDIATSMMRRIDVTLLEGSAVVGPNFADEFKARLQAHHGTYTTAMDRIAFENAFTAALEAEGHSIEQAPSATTRFWDVRIDGRPTSVKSTNARGLKPDTILISKLCEAAWIQDVRSANSRRQKTIELFSEFLSIVQGWFLLRIFTLADGFLYELVEIPVQILGHILELPRLAFDSDSPRINVNNDDGVTLYQLKLDRSDAKITIARLRKDACIVHGQWRLYTT